jgi:hypothetical protein
MTRLFNRIPTVFSRFYDGLIPNDEIAQKTWESYSVMYDLEDISI